MSQLSLQIPDEINDIISSLKQTFSISSIVEVSGVSTIITESVTIFDNLIETMLLKSGMVVTLGNVNYQVTNIVNSTTKSFDITATGLTDTEWNVAASFKFGSRNEINQGLNQETNNDNKLKRFPLIWLFTPIEKDFDNQVIDFESDLVFAFAFQANKTDRFQTRLDGNIKTILEPLLKLFTLWMQSSDFNYMFEFEGYQKPIDVKTNNFYFYGTSDQSKSVLNTTTDAIEAEITMKFKKQFEYPTFVDYKNGVVTNAIFGDTAILDFEARINLNTSVTFTVDWGSEIGTSTIVSTLVNGAYKTLQTSIAIPEGVAESQTISITDNFGGSYSVDYTVGYAVPFHSDLSTWHEVITDNTFAEGIENLPAKFLPRMAGFNGTDGTVILDSEISIPTNAAFEISFGVICNNYAAGAIAFGSNASGSNYVFLIAAFGVRLNYSTQSNDFTTIDLDIGIYQEIKISGDGVNITVQNITKSQTETQAAIVPFIICQKIGARSTDTLLLDGAISHINLPNNRYIFLGQGDYEYDISVNSNNGTWSGTGDRFTYDLNGSLYPNSNGYSLWQHATLEDIQVPYDINGLPLVLTPGTDIPTGYTKTKDLSNVVDSWNMSDALIDFENSGEAAIDIYDRSNVTRQTSTSRASIYYNAANPYRYNISELDARDFNKFFESSYKDKVFPKLSFDEVLTSLEEVPNYTTQKTGASLSSVLEYINILSSYPTDVNIPIPRDTPGIEYWVRPIGQVYGNGSGDSYINAFTGFGGIANLSPGDILHIRGTHNEYFLCGSKVGLGTDTNYVTIDFGADTETDFGVIDLQNLGNNGIEATGRYNIGFEYPRVTNINVSGTSLNLACYNIIFRNGDFSNSGNQGTQLLVTSKAIYYRCKSHNNVDDGFSQHDDTEGQYYYCEAIDNSQGFNIVTTSLMNLYGCIGSGNTLSDLDAGAGTIMNDHYGTYEKAFVGDVNELRLYIDEI